jgi:hypothetical protein
MSEGLPSGPRWRASCCLVLLRSCTAVNAKVKKDLRRPLTRRLGFGFRLLSGLRCLPSFLKPRIMLQHHAWFSLLGVEWMLGCSQTLCSSVLAEPRTCRRQIPRSLIGFPCIDLARAGLGPPNNSFFEGCTRTKCAALEMPCTGEHPSSAFVRMIRFSRKSNRDSIQCGGHKSEGLQREKKSLPVEY